MKLLAIEAVVKQPHQLMQQQGASKVIDKRNDMAVKGNLLPRKKVM